MDIEAATAYVMTFPESQQAAVWRAILNSTFDPKAQAEFQKDHDENRETAGGPGA